MAAVDLSKLSDSDLMALKSGDLTKVSDSGLMFLKGGTPRMAETAFEKEAKQIVQTTPAELVAGSAPVRFAFGSAAPILGTAQLGAELLGDKTGSETLAQFERMKQAGMKAYGQEGIDFIGMGGNIVSPAFLKAAKAIPQATTVSGRIGQGAVIGGGAGASTPVTDDDYWSTKAGQVLLGSVIGSAISGGAEAARGVAKGFSNLKNMLTPGGAEKILTAYQKSIIGEGNLPAVTAALRSAPEHVPGSKPTAAEALVGVPEGSPIVAHQRLTASTRGGVSAQFGQRKLDQEKAISDAILERSRVTGPMRESNLQFANLGQGVRSNEILNKIDQMATTPGLRASDVVRKTLDATKEKIAGLTDTQGRIDAHDLYTVRKEIGNTIQTFSKETANWDKKLAANLEGDIQKHIDNAIEFSGGVGWRGYLAEFSKRSRAIEMDEARRKAMFRPPQRTTLGGGASVAEESRVHLPNMLTRPMMATNFILRKLGEGIEPRLDRAAAQRYLDPKLLADELDKLPILVRGRVVNDLIQRGRLPALAGGIQSIEQEVQQP